MVLTDYERLVVTELLSGISDEDLIQLARTVSNKLVNVSTAKRAMDVILLHSPSVESILTRKKISKLLLFNYLHFKQIPIQSNESKEKIIQQILTYWKQMALTQNPEISNMNYEAESRTLNIKETSTTESPSSCTEALSLASESQMSENNSLVSNINIEQLGSEFIKWFSNKFNACNADSGYSFDSTMFFSNATAEFRIVRNVNQEMVENANSVESSQLIGQAFSELQRVYNLYMNMNGDSLKVTRNSYGNILIGTCGSLHSASQLVGVYEQLFQLFHDPLCTLTDRPVWKIQKLLLNCKFTNSCQQIESQGTSEMAELEYHVPYLNS